MKIPRLRAPIVLVHGVLGYGRIKLYGWTLASYFANIPEALASAGNRVLVPHLSPTGPIADRAGQLKNFIERESPQEPVHLIAHSMGGLDSRHLISRLGMANSVLTLTTIGTPHRGSPFADWGVSRFDRLARSYLERFDIPFDAFVDLTTQKCRLFNEQTPDAPGVRYFSVAGRHEGRWYAPEWQLPHSIVLKAEGPNDGVVSLSSAKYGESNEEWKGDHVSLINWLNPISLRSGLCQERTPQYAGLVQRLADEGF